MDRRTSCLPRSRRRDLKASILSRSPSCPPPHPPRKLHLYGRSGRDIASKHTAQHRAISSAQVALGVIKSLAAANHGPLLPAPVLLYSSLRKRSGRRQPPAELSPCMLYDPYFWLPISRAKHSDECLSNDSRCFENLTFACSLQHRALTYRQTNTARLTGTSLMSCCRKLSIGFVCFCWQHSADKLRRPQRE